MKKLVMYVPDDIPLKTVNGVSFKMERGVVLRLHVKPVMAKHEQLFQFFMETISASWC